MLLGGGRDIPSASRPALALGLRYPIRCLRLVVKEMGVNRIQHGDA